MEQWFNSLTERERLIVLVGGAVSALLIIWMGIIQPQWSQYRKLEKSVAEKQTEIKNMAEIKGQILQMRSQKANSSQSGGMSIQQMVENTLNQWRLKDNIDRMDSSGSNKINMVLNNADAERLFKMMNDLENKHNLRINNFNIRATKTKGLVNVRLMAER